MDVKNVRKWYHEFLSGCANVHDQETSGRLSYSDETVHAAEAKMLKIRRVTVEDLKEKLKGVCLGRDSICVILKETWNYRKVFARVVGKNSPPEMASFIKFF